MVTTKEEENRRRQNRLRDRYQEALFQLDETLITALEKAMNQKDYVLAEQLIKKILELNRPAYNQGL